MFYIIFSCIMIFYTMFFFYQKCYTSTSFSSNSSNHNNIIKIKNIIHPVTVKIVKYANSITVTIVYIGT